MNALARQISRSLHLASVERSLSNQIWKSFSSRLGTLQASRQTRLSPIISSSQRGFALTSCQHCEAASDSIAEEGDAEGGPVKLLRKIVDVEDGIKYMQSSSYKLTYGDDPVWVPYKRNHKGGLPPRKTRKTCVRGGALSTGNPCPICRDEYLVIHPKNAELLKQFVSPSSGNVISYEKTGVCQTQHKKLLVAVQQAWDMGYMEMPVPMRTYDYERYFPDFKGDAINTQNTEGAASETPAATGH